MTTITDTGSALTQPITVNADGSIQNRLDDYGSVKIIFKDDDLDLIEKSMDKNFNIFTGVNTDTIPPTLEFITPFKNNQLTFKSVNLDIMKNLVEGLAVGYIKNR